MSFIKDDKGFIFRSGPVKKTNNYYSFWDDTQNNNDEVDSFLGLSDDQKTRKDIVQLAGYKRAISNFVSIVTGENIPVVFNSKDESFTDGKRVVIGGNLSDKNFDVSVGLALHEGSHIKLSDFDLVKNLDMEIPQELFVLGEQKNISKYIVTNLVKSMLNWIEDRRIDNFVFKSSPGYKGYYHSMYDKYFHDKTIDKALLSAEMRLEDIDSYQFRIINLINKNRQLGSLKGLREIWNVSDLKNISRLKDTRDCFELSLKITSIILKNVDKVELSDDTQNQQQNGDNGNGMNGDGESGNGDNTLTDDEFDDLLDSIENGSGDGDSGDGGTDGSNSISVNTTGLDLPNSNNTPPSSNLGNDDGKPMKELTDRQKGLLKKAIEKQKEFLSNNIKKTNLSKKDSKDIKAIEDSGATYQDVGKDVSRFHWDNSVGKGTRCLVIKKLTPSLIDSNQFACMTKYNLDSYNDSDRRYKNYNFVEEGLRLGSILGRKLQVRSEERTTKHTRKNGGKIDKRLIAELGFDNGNIFSQTFVDRFNKAYLHISIDASSSMGGGNWNKAMTSAVAMIKACDMSGNIDVVVSIRSTHNDYGSTAVPLIAIVYDSRTDKLSKVKNLFGSLDARGTTPEGLCFEAIAKDMIPGNSKQDSYFINYSDGQPYFGNNDLNYSGHSAVSHTRKQVRNMRKQGLRVLSYFISDYDYNDEPYGMDDFKVMYGKDATFINATNMMDVARTMNKMFLKKD